MSFYVSNYGDFDTEKFATIEDFIKHVNAEHIMMALINNRPASLDSKIEDGTKIKLIDLSSTLGQKVFKRSITFLFFKVLHDLFPYADAEVCHTINRGEFCRVKNRILTNCDMERIKKAMIVDIDKDLKFIQSTVEVRKSSHLIEDQRFELYQTISKDNCTIYSLGGYVDYSGGLLVPSTRYLRNFDIVQMENKGILILCPTKSNPNELDKYLYQPNLMKAFDQVENWSKIHNIHYLADMNNRILNNDYREMIQICEALQEAEFANIAKQIKTRNAKIVYITGPSSSGKTTSANRTRIQLMVNGSHPLVISMDDYFIDRDEMIPGPDGKVDFEALEVVNLEIFKKQVDELLSGKGVRLRKFDFKTGKGYYEESITLLDSNSEIIVEGIHAFNPVVQDLLDEHIGYKICVNPIAYINIDNHNRISATDCRKLRRIVRDNKHRNLSAEKTIEMWPNIRAGEEKNIFPYLETADAILNTSLAYEVSVLKKHASRALSEITDDNDNYAEAQRLLNLLSLFVSLEDESDIPKTSILQEFLS